MISEVKSYGVSYSSLRFKTRVEVEYFHSHVPILEFPDPPNAQLVWGELNGEQVAITERPSEGTTFYGSKEGLLPPTGSCYNWGPLDQKTLLGEAIPLHFSREESWGIKFQDYTRDPFNEITRFKTKSEADLILRSISKGWGLDPSDLGEVVLGSGPPTHQLIWSVTEDGVEESPKASPDKVHMLYGSSSGLLPSREGVAWTWPLDCSEFGGRWIWTRTNPPQPKTPDPKVKPATFTVRATGFSTSERELTFATSKQAVYYCNASGGSHFVSEPKSEGNEVNSEYTLIGFHGEVLAKGDEAIDRYKEGKLALTQWEQFTSKEPTTMKPETKDTPHAYLLRNHTHTLCFKTREEAEIARNVVYASNWEILPADSSQVPNTQLIWFENENGLVQDGLQAHVSRDPTEKAMGSREGLLPPLKGYLNPNTVNVSNIIDTPTWCGIPIHTAKRGVKSQETIEGLVRSYECYTRRFATREEAELVARVNRDLQISGTGQQVYPSSKEPNSQLVWVENELGDVVKDAFSRWSPFSVFPKETEKLFGSKGGLLPSWEGPAERDTFVVTSLFLNGGVSVAFPDSAIHYSRDPMDFEHLGLTLSHHRVAELAPHIKATEDGIQAARAMLNIVCSAPLADNLDEVMPGLRGELDRLTSRWGPNIQFDSPIDRAIQSYLIAIRSALLSLTYADSMHGLRVAKVLLKDIYEVTKSERARLGLLRMATIVQVHGELSRQETEEHVTPIESPVEGSMSNLLGVLGTLAAFAGVASLVGRSTPHMRVKPELESLPVVEERTSSGSTERKSLQ